MSNPKEGYIPTTQRETNRTKWPMQTRRYIERETNQLKIDKLENRMAAKPKPKRKERKELVKKLQALKLEREKREWDLADDREMMLKKTAKRKRKRKNASQEKSIHEQSAMENEIPTTSVLSQPKDSIEIPSDATEHVIYSKENSPEQDQIPANSFPVASHSATQEQNQQNPSLREYTLHGKTFSLNDIREEYLIEEFVQIEQEKKSPRSWGDIPHDEGKIIDKIVKCLYEEIYPNPKDRIGIKGKAFSRDKKAVISRFNLIESVIHSRAKELKFNQK